MTDVGQRYDCEYGRKGTQAEAAGPETSVVSVDLTPTVLGVLRSLPLDMASVSLWMDPRPHATHTVAGVEARSQDDGHVIRVEWQVAK